MEGGIKATAQLAALVEALDLKVITSWLEPNHQANPLFEDRGLPPRQELPLPTRPPYTTHLGNLSFDATEGDIYDFFTGCEVDNVRIVEDKLDSKPKGFGYAEFKTLDGLKKALTLSGVQFQGRNIRISVAEPRKEIDLENLFMNLTSPKSQRKTVKKHAISATGLERDRYLTFRENNNVKFRTEVDLALDLHEALVSTMFLMWAVSAGHVAATNPPMERSEILVTGTARALSLQPYQLVLHLEVSIVQ